MDNTVLSIIIGLVIAAICAFAVYYKTKKDSDNQEAAEKFLEGLADTILDTIMTIIHQFDPSHYKNVEDFEKDVLKQIYDTVWDYLSVKSQEAYYDNIIVKAVLNILDKQFILDFIDGLLVRDNIYDVIRSAYAAPVIESGEIETEDEKMIEEFSNQEEYFENVEPCDLAPAEEEVVDESGLNPQKDEGEPISDDDTSIEEVSPSNILTKKDKNGKTLYYILDENNKKKRISKEEALLSGYEEE